MRSATAADQMFRFTHQEEQVVVASLLGVDAPARGGAAAQDKLAQPRSLQTGGDKVFMFINDW